MKHGIWLRASAMLGAACLCLALAGCTVSAQPPASAADGTPWSEDWVTVGGVVGVETPDGMSLEQNNAALAGSGMYYASWSMGDSEPYLNEDGEEVPLYDAQLHLLLSSPQNAEQAQSNLAEWMKMAREMYLIRTEDERTCGTQTFTVMTYGYDAEENPYEAGASAFGIFDDNVLSVEVACRNALAEDAEAILTDFLAHCHYAPPAGAR